MSRKLSYDEDATFPENCGVNFDGKCNPAVDQAKVDFSKDYEEAGECEEGDEECFIRRQQGRSLGATTSNMAVDGGSKRGSLKSTEASNRRSIAFTEYDLDGDEEDSKGAHAQKSKNRAPTFPDMKDIPFEGISKDYYKKNFKPDYPTELIMKQVCTAKPRRRRTVGSTKTQPKAVFIPLDSTVAAQDKASKKKASWMSSMRNSKAEVENPAGIEEPSPLEENRMPPPIVSSSDEVIVDWLEDHNVQMMFEYFLGLCVIHKPEDPWQYISELAGKMIEGRTDWEAFDSLPRILTPEHTEAIFRIYDRIENGVITLTQYKSAMEAMGLNRFSLSPDGWEENAISKDTFIKESTDAINELLRSFMVFTEQPKTEDAGAAVDTAKSGSAAGIERATASGTFSSSYSSSGKSGTATGSEFSTNAGPVTPTPPPPLNFN